MIGAADMSRLVRFCREHEIRLVSDEIYHGITYGAAAATARASGPAAIVVNSFSKYYCMTGWRLGWMLVPPDLARSVECLSQNFHVSPPALAQMAAIEAFGCHDELDRHVARYRQNRDILKDVLAAAGLDRFAPADGAFYLYADVSRLTGDSEQLCRRLLAETGVAITPGRDFDPIAGDTWVRLSYAGATAEVAEAARRLGDWLGKRTSDP
jgi:aspartate/methionine/tyrosine aminotransferase